MSALSNGTSSVFAMRSALSEGSGLMGCTLCRLEPSLAAGRERPHVAIKNATEQFHLAIGSHAEPFGDTPAISFRTPH